MRDINKALWSLPGLAVAVWVLLASNEDPAYFPNMLGLNGDNTMGLDQSAGTPLSYEELRAHRSSPRPAD